MKLFGAKTKSGGAVISADLQQLIDIIAKVYKDRPVGILLPEWMLKLLDKKNIEAVNFVDVLRKQMTIEELRQKDVLIIPFTEDNSQQIIKENWSKFMGNDSIVEVYDV